MTDAPPLPALYHRRLRCTLHIPPGAQLAQARAWADAVFTNEAPDPEEAADTAGAASPMPTGDASAREQAAGFAQLTVRLAGALLRLARVPAFGPATVVELLPPAAGPGWPLQCALPQVDYLDSRLYERALDLARGWVMDRAVTPFDPDQVSALQDAVWRGPVAALMPMAPGAASTFPVLQAAWQADVPLLHLNGGVFQLGWGSRARRLDRSTTDRDSAIGAKLTGDKNWTARVLRDAGLPAPIHALVDSPEQALAAAQAMGWPVVIKPLRCEGGDGVTVDIRHAAQVHLAMETARRAGGSPVLVEKQVPGLCHRVLVAFGAVLYVVRRGPLSVVGDGQRSIAALVQAAAERRARLAPWDRAEGDYVLDHLALETLSAAGHTADEVPAPGSTVALRPAESATWGRHDEDVTRQTHRDNADIAIRAARLLNLEVAGIDLVTTDISQPWHHNGAVINEVNFAPLLGGGETSRRHLPLFIQHLMGGSDGRLPVEAFVGGDGAVAAARERQKAHARAGHSAHIALADQIVLPDGQTRRLAVRGLAAHCRALVLDAAVTRIIVVVQDDECLGQPWLLDRLTAVFTPEPGPGAPPAADYGPEGIYGRLASRLLALCPTAR